jgi:hypothetical protein
MVERENLVEPQPKELMSQEVRSQNKVFVPLIAVGRSGSTLLMRILNRFDGVCIKGESNGIVAHLADAILAAHHPILERRRQLALGDLVATTPFDLLIGTDADPWFGGELILPERLSKAIGKLLLEEVLCAGSEHETPIAGLKK